MYNSLLLSPTSWSGVVRIVRGHPVMGKRCLSRGMSCNSWASHKWALLKRSFHQRTPVNKIPMETISYPLLHSWQTTCHFPYALRCNKTVYGKINFLCPKCNGYPRLKYVYKGKTLAGWTPHTRQADKDLLEWQLRKHPSPSSIEVINVWYQGKLRGLDAPVVRRDGSFSTMPPGTTA